MLEHAGTMCDHHDRHAAAAHLVDRIQERLLAHPIQAGIGLIEHQQCRRTEQRARQGDTLALTAGKDAPRLADLCFLLVALAMVFGQPLSGSLDFNLTGWFVMFLLAIPGAALMTFMWGHALQLITPTQATITVGLNPVTALLLGGWILSEPVTLRIALGLALLIIAIVVTTSDTRDAPTRTR